MKQIGNFLLKIIIYGLLIIFSFLIQHSVLSQALNLSIVPNIMIILTCMTGFLRGDKSGLFTGFFSGLLIDMYFGPLLGFNAFIFMLIGAVSGIIGKLFYKNQVIIPILLVFISDFVYNFYYYIFRFLLRNKLNFAYYLKTLIMPEVVLTLILAIILYGIFLKIGKKYIEEDSGSVLTFD